MISPKKEKWTIRIIMLSAKTVEFFEEEIPIEEEIMEFDDILCTRDDIIQILNTANTNPKLFSIIFPKSYYIAYFSIPLEQLLHVSALLTKEKNKNSSIVQNAEEIIRGKNDEKNNTII